MRILLLVLILASTGCEAVRRTTITIDQNPLTNKPVVKVEFRS